MAGWLGMSREEVVALLGGDTPGEQRIETQTYEGTTERWALVYAAGGRPWAMFPEYLYIYLEGRPGDRARGWWPTEKGRNMKKQIILSISIMAALALLLTACGGGSARSVQEEVAVTLGLDLSRCEVVSSWDDHGGFHGDGTAFAELKLLRRWGAGPNHGGRRLEGLSP